MADLGQQPGLPTPPGVASQFPTTHSSEQAWYYVVAVLCTVIPGILLVMRLYTKLYIIRRADVTDYIIVTAFIFFLSLMICGRMGLAAGAGVHQWNLTVDDLSNVQYWLYVVEIVYAPTIFLVKMAILLQYLRMFAPQKIVNPMMWWSARAIIVVTGIYYVISTFITIFACSPREAIWDPLVTNGTCLDNDTLVLVTCLFNIISDIVILSLPARTVWKLRIPARKKIAIVLLFAIGVLACVANGMIIYYLTQSGGPDADASYNIEWLGLWAFAEITLGIIVTCTFLLPKFFETHGASLRGLFSSLARPFTSLTSHSQGTHLAHAQGKRSGSEGQHTAPYIASLPEWSDKDLPLRNYRADIESYPTVPTIPDKVFYPHHVRGSPGLSDI